MRLHELAKEIGAESKLLVQLAKELGLRAKNHSSTLAPGEISLLKAAYRETYGDTTPVAEPTAVEAEQAAKEAEAAAPEAPRRRRTRKAAADTDAETDDATETADRGVDEEPVGAGTGADAEDAESVIEAETDADDGGDVPAPESAPAEVTATAPAPATSSEPDAGGGATAPAPEVAPAPSEPRKTAHKPAARVTEHVTTGKPPQTPTPRRRATGGAKIVGRIELPQEEINRARSIAAGAPGPGPQGGAGVEELPGAREDGRGLRGLGDRDDRRRGTVVKPRTEGGTPWAPEEEDDPLLQGIRVGNVQRGPHGRRPPRRVGPRKSGRKSPIAQPVGPIDVSVPISIRDLSQALGAKVNQIINIFMRKGMMYDLNVALDEAAVLEIAAELGRDVNITAAKGKEETFLEEVDAFAKEMNEKYAQSQTRVPRPPVVAFLGHVDHGKTSLLDRIRSANVAAGEAGGITQSMRAYSVETANGRTITMLDTPGHRAFTEMRARGANVTDIVVLVVAADDGVMPQTEEAIQHARAAGTPIVVAMNKIDKHEANPDRVLQMLAQAGVMAEEWGGDVQVARVSAVTGDGIQDLLEKILLQAEIMDITADPDRPALGTTLEARKDEKLGAVATILIRDGTLRVGDTMLAGTAYGRVRALVNDQGKSVQSAGPSVPVNVIGMNGTPDAGEKAYVVENLRTARDVAEEREHAARTERVAGPTPGATITLENLFASLEAGKVEEIRVVLKADVKGSLEVLKTELSELKTAEVKVRVIRDALGGITEDDVLLAAASQALVIGFNVVSDEKARGVAETRGVDIKSYQVIYELIDDLKKAMEGALSPLAKENILGHVEIKEVFKVSKLGNIAGCRVTDGIVRRNAHVRLTREGRVIYTGKLDSLKRFKDDVREVKEGLECGLRIDGYDDIKVGDVVEVFEITEEKRTLDLSST